MLLLIFNELNVGDWTGIVYISAGSVNSTGGKKDGTVVEEGKDITIEKDISYIEKGGSSYKYILYPLDKTSTLEYYCNRYLYLKWGFYDYIKKVYLGCADYICNSYDSSCIWGD